MGWNEIIQKGKKIFGKIQTKHIFYLLFIIFLLSLVPLFYLGKYNFSGADDFSMGHPAHNVWQNTHSLFDTIKEACWMVQDTYHAWMGSYSAVFLNALPPSVFGEQFYCVVPIVLLLMLSISVFRLGNLLFYRILKMDQYASYIVILIGLLLITQFLPSPIEGFYWWQGGIYYTFFFSLSLHAAVHALRFVYFEKKENINLIICIILSFICAGSNYLTAITSPLLILLILVISLLYRKRKAAKLSIAIVFAVGGLLISMVAPGNAIRAEGLPEFSLVGSLFEAFKYAFIQTDAWLNVVSLLSLCFLLPFMAKMVKTTTYHFRYPLLISILSLCYLAASCFPSLYAAGWIGAGRLLNVIYYHFIGLLFLNVLYWIGWIEKRGIRVYNISFATLFLQELKTYKAIAALSFVFIFTAYIYANGIYLESSSVKAFKSITSGEAWQYKYEMEERQKLLNDDSTQKVELQPLSVKPELLFFDDITLNNDDWRNVAMRKWYQKEVIVIKSNED